MTSARVRTLIGAVVVASIALILPLNGIATLVLDIRAPAHHHAEVELAAAFDAAYAEMHSHAATERHHHAPDEGAILEAGDHHHDRESGEGPSKRSAGFSGDALLHRALPDRSRLALTVRRGANAAKLAPAYLRRLERPPKAVRPIQTLLG